LCKQAYRPRGYIDLLSIISCCLGFKRCGMCFLSLTSEVVVSNLFAVRAKIGKLKVLKDQNMFFCDNMKYFNDSKKGYFFLELQSEARQNPGSQMDPGLHFAHP
ncbi:hypothetical protein AMECASPLE_015200, partial [Ameca splendens]